MLTSKDFLAVWKSPSLNYALELSPLLKFFKTLTLRRSLLRSNAEHRSHAAYPLLMSHISPAEGKTDAMLQWVALYK
jgi:hypothetical protein